MRERTVCERKEPGSRNPLCRYTSHDAVRVLGRRVRWCEPQRGQGTARGDAKPLLSEPVNDHLGSAVHGVHKSLANSFCDPEAFCRNDNIGEREKKVNVCLRCPVLFGVVCSCHINRTHLIC